MLLRGRVWRDGRHWVAEIPLLDAMTQGHSKKDVLVMVADLVETLVDDPSFRARVRPDADGQIAIGGSCTKALTALLLRRQRGRSGLTLAEVAERLGARSHNAYARYEQGLSQPTVEKLSELLAAVAPDRELLLDQVGE